MVFSLKSQVGAEPTKKGSHTQVSPKDLVTPKYEKNDRVLVIDGDVLAFKVSSVCENVFRYTHKITKESIAVKSQKAFRDHLRKVIEAADGYCDLDDIKVELENWNVADVKEPEQWGYCERTLRQAMKKLLKTVNCSKYEIYIGGDNNFRLQLPLPEQYKISRTAEGAVDKRPYHLNAAKRFLVDNFGAVIIKDKEADDVVQMRSYELTSQGNYCVVYTNDKDARQAYYGDWYNPNKEKIETLSDYVGEIFEDQSVKGCGLVWLLYQVNQGDITDGYNPKRFYSKEVYKRGYGHKAFYNDFKDIKCPKLLLEKFIDVSYKLLGEHKHKFISWDGEEQDMDWLDIVELMFACAYMQIYREDNTTFKSLCLKHGVEDERIFKPERV